jgi:phospholipase C
MLRLRDHYHHGASQRVVLDAGAARTLAWPIARQHHWYDIEMESGEAGAYHYRLAGHIETGAASRSDPALGGEALAQPNAQVA